MDGRQLPIPHIDPSGRVRSRAERVQRSVDQADTDLVAIARRARPLIAWWWGVRTVDGAKCAWCYVCDRRIVLAALNTHVSADALDAIDAHRAGHWSDVRAYRQGVS